MGIKMIRLKNGEPLIEYEIPNFIKKNNEVGDSSENFEIMQLLGKGGFSEVLKVKSKINFGIYAMKKIDLVKFFEKYPDQEFEKYYENEILFLQTLDHPNIIKCHNIFKEGKYIFFIMEFMNNGDLESYYKIMKSLNLDIPEDKLWNIFYKCLCGLDYIHKKNIIHRDIKPPNLFLDDKFNVKIGDFNVSAVVNKQDAIEFTDDEEQIEKLLNNYTCVGTRGYQAEEILRGLKFGKPVDIYAMGISFYQLLYGQHPMDGQTKRQCSNDIKKFISDMIQTNPNNRPTSNEAMMKAKKFFIKTYVKNTSVESVLNCFSNFPNFTSYFTNNQNEQKICEHEISRMVFSIIQSLKVNDEDQTQNELYNLRKSLEKEGLDIKADNIEISLGNFLSYFIGKLNTELNEIKGEQYINISKDDKIAIYKIQSKNYSFQQYSEEQAFNKIINAYYKKISSIISKNFFSFIKIKRTCRGCINTKYYFSKLYFIPINVNIMNKKFGNYHDINIKNSFDCLKETTVIVDKKKGKKCDQCGIISEFNESKNFFHTAKNLIFILDRGESLENKTFINFDESLTLTNSEVERYSQVNYQLIGIISFDKGEYISFVKQNNIWISSKGQKYNFNEAKKNGIVVALFYYSDENILILEPKKDSNDNNANQFTNSVGNINQNTVNSQQFINGTLANNISQMNINNNQQFHNNNNNFSGQFNNNINNQFTNNINVQFNNNNLNNNQLNNNINNNNGQFNNNNMNPPYNQQMQMGGNNMNNPNMQMGGNYMNNPNMQMGGNYMNNPNMQMGGNYMNYPQGQYNQGPQYGYG